MNTKEAVELARRTYLDEAHVHGCAETAFVVLKRAYGIEGADDASPAMAFNGGIAYTGGPCGAVTGAALAVGLLAQRRIDDHRAAKRAARELVAGLADAFVAEHGSLACRELTGFDLRAPGGHDAFLASGVWRDSCMRQIDFAVRRLAPLADAAAWERALREAGVPPED